MKTWAGACVIVCACAALAAGGCHAPPLVVDGALHERELHAQLHDAHLWRRDETTPDRAPGSRAAVLECTVEFITMKQVTPSPRQAMFGGPFSPWTALVELSGIFRRQVAYPEQVFETLPDSVHAALERALIDAGYDVVSSKEVATSRTLGRLERSDSDASSIVRHLNLIGGDTGRVNQYRAIPAHPLPALHGESEKTLAIAERALLAELDVDLVVRLRLRVGMYMGRVSIEQDSRLWLASDMGEDRAQSVRSIVSEALVGGYDDLQPVSGQRYFVDWDGFTRQAERLAGAYAQSGLTAILGNAAMDGPAEPDFRDAIADAASN